MTAELNDDELQRLIEYARRKFREERWPLSPELHPIHLLMERLAADNPIEIRFTPA
jgi:hypothetical protein